MPRYAKRRDNNESELIELAEQLGAVWIQAGPFDGWLWWRQWHCVEIKRADKEGWKSEYTAYQRKLMQRFQERGVQMVTWRRPEDVYALMGAIQTAGAA